MKNEEWGEQFWAVTMKDGGGEKCEKNFKMWCSRFILKNNLKNQNQNYFFFFFECCETGSYRPSLIFE